jgi:hypothetical protein
MQHHLAVFLNVRSLDEKMPNDRTKTLAGDGSIFQNNDSIAPDDKALDEKGWTAWTRMCRKSEEECAVSQKKNLPCHQFFKTL